MPPGGRENGEVLGATQRINRHTAQRQRRAAAPLTGKRHQLLVGASVIFPVPYPPGELSPSEALLKDFEWRGKERPEKVEDLLLK